MEEVETLKNVLLSNGSIICNPISKKFAFVNNSGTIIDHFITDILKYKFFFNILNTSLSDHQLLFISVDRTPILENGTSFKTILNYENIDNDIFWGNLNNLNSFNELVNTLSDVIKKNTEVIPFKANK